MDISRFWATIGCVVVFGRTYARYPHRAVFDARELNWPIAERVYGTPGIAAAFMGGEFTEQDLQQLSNDDRVYHEIEDAKIRLFLDQALLGDFTEDHEYNPDIVDFILQQTIVVEQSPPFGIPFEHLLKGASVSSIGTAVGYYGLHEPLLFAAVPAGIVLVGSAVAIAKVIEQGISYLADRLAKGKTLRETVSKPSRPSRPDSSSAHWTNAAGIRDAVNSAKKKPGSKAAESGTTGRRLVPRVR